ncbi:MAG: hypothetical protein ACHP7B_05175 [Burkholderiales bacterium]|jgi:hypothetical protein
MFRKQSFTSTQLLAATILAVGVSGAALADDNSMNRLTGDSYAYFNNLEFSLGKFNMARAPYAQPPDSLARVPKDDVLKEQRPIMLAGRPAGITLTSPFRDDKGA